MTEQQLKKVTTAIIDLAEYLQVPEEEIINALSNGMSLRPHFAEDYCLKREYAMLIEEMDSFFGIEDETDD